jgi:flagellar hook-basal body complex protein FliE
MAINGISSNLSSIYAEELKSKAQKSTTTGETTGQSFTQVLDSLTHSQASSDDLIQQMAMGEDVDVHDAMIAAEETDINFKIAIGIRDRLVDAYKEVMRMAV